MRVIVRGAIKINICDVVLKQYFSCCRALRGRSHAHGLLLEKLRLVLRLSRAEGQRYEARQLKVIDIQLL